MQPDPTVTFASANWIRQPIELEPFHQLGGVLPAKRQNTEFLDQTNTWLVTAAVDYLSESPPASAYSSNVRPDYLKKPGLPPPRCHLAEQAGLRSAIGGATTAEPRMPLGASGNADQYAAETTSSPSLFPLVVGFGIIAVVVLFLIGRRRR